MNDEQLDRLLRAAREHEHDTSRAEFGFETRLLARLREDSPMLYPLGRWSWRLAPVFLALTLICGWWGLNALDVTLTSAVVGTRDEWMMVEYMTGKRL